MSIRNGNERYSRRSQGGLYEDTGCELAGVDSCLKCPLPVCKEEMDGSQIQRLRNQLLDTERAERMRRRGWSVARAAEEFGVTQRTVFRMLARVAKAQPGR